MGGGEVMLLRLHWRLSTHTTIGTVAFWIFNIQVIPGGSDVETIMGSTSGETPEGAVSD